MVGLKKFNARADVLAKTYGPQFEVPALMREMEKKGETFYQRFNPAANDSYTKSALNKMLEKDVVKIAHAMGISATVDDLKKDTIEKILTKQG